MKKLNDSTDSFDSQSNWRKAKNLRGRLLLAYGTLDDNVHPVATELVIDELIKANRDFDLIIAPNERSKKFSVVNSSCRVLPGENSSECIDSLLANPVFLFSSMTSRVVCPEISLIKARY